MDAVEVARVELLELLDPLRSMNVISAEQLADVRRRAFAAANDVVERTGVTPAQGLILLKEHSVAVNSLLRKRWPSMFASIRSRLTFEDHFPLS
jgi:hypothetical protein